MFRKTPPPRRSHRASLKNVLNTVFRPPIVSSGQVFSPCAHPIKRDLVGTSTISIYSNLDPRGYIYIYISKNGEMYPRSARNFGTESDSKSPNRNFLISAFFTIYARFSTRQDLTINSRIRKDGKDRLKFRERPEFEKM